ncbi:ribosome biogenesis GTP-binding protein YihA/YsxC [Metamycoplasma hyosynoviae]|uniref:ribosome biogenesis GTP-binding protein YihA/YsxC n=1 Tax=Metamycoplasma hyosynoviae TaxID=29559 RepID=UPI002358A4CC|nr:ribosome biogenesis GTP-binding protein YihA/YsxC [Metamycoplasma hyosynoviae]MDC8918530.1 ribosome biogenesis GTP-binding protein YihA/YsxC [Metamycoplasma hyosynoviae]
MAITQLSFFITYNYLIMWKFLKGSTSQNSWYSHSGKELVFWGRSNVGKSSLINAISGDKISRTSQKPGKTREINYFETNNGKIIVDLPGYGYANVSKKMQDKISGLIDHYFTFSQNEKEVLLLLDAKIGVTAIDKEMINYLMSKNLVVHFVFTKLDKAKQEEIYASRKQINEISENINIFFVSNTIKKGINTLKEFLNIY